MRPRPTRDIKSVEQRMSRSWADMTASKSWAILLLWSRSPALWRLVGHRDCRVFGSPSRSTPKNKQPNEVLRVQQSTRQILAQSGNGHSRCRGQSRVDQHESAGLAPPTPSSPQRVPPRRKVVHTGGRVLALHNLIVTHEHEVTKCFAKCDEPVSRWCEIEL